ncbi:hypothetical protein CMI40_01425 [Candidatus Pacearchaeota archaeon]|jgi:hypothetical protein|nr:hypothetical protein [Candidatus Pacearchaeota archaeon]|tara:strand:- start:16556 stop:17326 length:771 start_codon:yes stop_codon:yes gene_type:complete
MNKQDLINKIILKKEFSQLPKKDVELAFEHFNKEGYVDEEKIKFTRNLLRKVFSAFTSQKILSLKDKSPEWILKKHLSTRERLNFYEEIYKRIFNGLSKKLSIIDLGSGINGFSYRYFKEIKYDMDYVGVESMGQLVNLTNNYFKKEKINGKAIHLSLFELEKIKKSIKKTEKPRIIFLFKTIDSLEMLERDYSKKLILEIAPLAERIVISFATESMITRKKFKVKRNWIINFLKENFEILDDFELGGERYIVFNK